MSEHNFKRLLIGILMTWTVVCGLSGVIIGCAERQPAIVKPSAGKILVPPQCFLPMYCKTAECIGARAEYHCYKVIQEPKGDEQ